MGERHPKLEWDFGAVPTEDQRPVDVVPTNAALLIKIEYDLELKCDLKKVDKQRVHKHFRQTVIFLKGLKNGIFII